MRHLIRPHACGVSALCAFGWSVAAPLGAVLVNLSTSHNFASPSSIGASASTQLAGLNSVADFQAIPSAERYVYSFETWPEATNSLGSNAYTFQFDLNNDGVVDQRVNFKQAGQATTLTKGTVANSSSPSTVLNGLGDIGWGSFSSSHTMTFETPVSAVGMVYRSASNFHLRKNAYNTVDNYPVSYTLTDGTVVHLGSAGISGALLNGNTNNYVGIVDTTGKGIVSFTSRTMGSASGASQYVTIDDMAFAIAPEPAVQNPVNLKSGHDFRSLSNITASASDQLSGLISVDQFRQLPEANRFVYSFGTWPLATASLGATSYPFELDLNGDGVSDQQVTVSSSGSFPQNLSKSTPGNNTSSPATALGGLGDFGWGGSTYSIHKLTFSKPVSAAGFVYRSASNMFLRKSIWNGNECPVSYKLTDGTIVNLGSPGVTGATITAGTNTFVGVKDTSGKGIVEVITRVQGSASQSQYASIDDLSFVLAGPPAGDWTLTFEDNFNGTALNTAVWSKGMRWAGIINNELQGYVPENVSVANGVCKLFTEKRTVVNKDWVNYASGNASYASGVIQTYNKFAQAYGYFEARMKMPAGIGTWPAFWLLPDRQTPANDVYYRTVVGNTVYYPNTTTAPCPMGNEIDVTEFFSAWQNPDTGMFKSHSGYFWGYGDGQSWGSYALANNGQGSAHYQFPNATSDFHTYGVYWAPGTLVFYVDGRKVLSRTHPTNIAVCPHYLILNCALHTNVWSRTATLAEIDAGLPSTTEIDYVKVWSGNTY